MPIYSYHCDSCGTDHTELKKIADMEKDPCPKCGADSHQVITPVRLDYASMGMDPGFPTAWERWGKQQFRKNVGRMRDQNNEWCQSESETR